MSFYLIQQQNESAEAWQAEGGEIKEITINGETVKCQVDEEGKITNDFLRSYAEATGQAG